VGLGARDQGELKSRGNYAIGLKARNQGEKRSVGARVRDESRSGTKVRRTAKQERHRPWEIVDQGRHREGGRLSNRSLTIAV
jgi:hypothetical protein